MQVPEIFSLLALNLSFYDEYRKSPPDWIAASLLNSRARDRNRLKAFLTETLQHRRSEAELRTIWRSTYAQFDVEGDIRNFLTAILDFLNDPPIWFKDYSSADCERHPVNFSFGMRARDQLRLMQERQNRASPNSGEIVLVTWRDLEEPTCSETGVIVINLVPDSYIPAKIYGFERLYGLKILFLINKHHQSMFEGKEIDFIYDRWSFART